MHIHVKLERSGITVHVGVTDRRLVSRLGTLLQVVKRCLLLLQLEYLVGSPIARDVREGTLELLRCIGKERLPLKALRLSGL